MTQHISQLIDGLTSPLVPVVYSGAACGCEGCNLGHRICGSMVLAFRLPRPTLRAVDPLEIERHGWPTLPMMEHGGSIKLCEDCGIAYGRRGYRVVRLEAA